MIGAERLCRALESLGVEVVFSLPGTQNVALFEALRKSRLRTIVATHELSASFMAIGYALASGRPGVLLTIPGPGFTYSLTGLAEALLDSVPLVSIVGKPAEGPGRRFQFQSLDQRAIATPLVKRIFDLESSGSIEATLEEAFAVSQAGEPGPVLVQVPANLLSDEVPASPLSPSQARLSSPPPVEEIAHRLEKAQRIVLYVGQGANGAAAELEQLAELLQAPFVTTTSARGVVPESNPWALCVDRGNISALNDLLESADLILALGCKFSHNGAHGFRLRLAPDRLVHVDASESVLGANYDASFTLAADVPSVIRALLACPASLKRTAGSGFSEEEAGRWRRRITEVAPQAGTTIRGARPSSIEGFFAALRSAMPAESCLILDSGRHQLMARRHFRVLRPRGLVLPADLQSMGFALPAAVGAKLAREERTVVAILGDGGFAMSGLELLTAVRERIPLTVIVFNDGVYGAISRQQLAAYGRLHGTELKNPDFQQFAESVGARYMLLRNDIESSLAGVVRSGGVCLVEAVVHESVSLRTRLRTLRDALVSRVS
ncbi:MAG: thiamine pyrophosphate-binding protein [Thermoanaerobaculia bacterium]